MNHVNAQLNGGSLDGASMAIQASVPPPVLRLKSFAGREVLYKVNRRIDATAWQYDFFDYWDGEIEFVEENP